MFCIHTLAHCLNTRLAAPRILRSLAACETADERESVLTLLFTRIRHAAETAVAAEKKARRELEAAAGTSLPPSDSEGEEEGEGAGGALPLRERLHGLEEAGERILVCFQPALERTRIRPCSAASRCIHCTRSPSHSRGVLRIPRSNTVFTAWLWRAHDVGCSASSRQHRKRRRSKGVAPPRSVSKAGRRARRSVAPTGGTSRRATAPPREATPLPAHRRSLAQWATRRLRPSPPPTRRCLPWWRRPSPRRHRPRPSPSLGHGWGAVWRLC